MILRLPLFRICQTLPKPIRSPSSLRRSTTTTSTHHDLPTFFAYAQNASLSPTSSVYVGTHFEYLCSAALRRLSFTLTRTGGRADAGIDLLGTWELPCLPYPLRVLVQCKALKAKVRPEVIRELEGAVAGAPDGWRGTGTVGVLCGKRPATKGVREAVRNSGMPVVWVMVEETGEGEGKVGKVRQVLWNDRVGELGLVGMGVGLKHMLGGEVGTEKEAVLLWKGVPWQPEAQENERAGLQSEKPSPRPVEKSESEAKDENVPEIK